MAGVYILFLVVIDYKTFVQVTSSHCMKKLLANFKSSLLQMSIYKCTKYLNYLQTHLHLIQTNLQALKLLKHICTDTKFLKCQAN
jgi:hypothetical protein